MAVWCSGKAQTIFGTPAVRLFEALGSSVSEINFFHPDVFQCVAPQIYLFAPKQVCITKVVLS